MKEEDIKDKYPSVSLHNIDKNRICLTIGQLKLILSIKDDDFNDILTDLCEKELKKKRGKSLDFFDTSNLINKAIKQIKGKDSKKLRPNKFKKVTFKEKEEALEEEEDDQKEEEKEDEKEDEKEETNDQKRLDMIEKRLEKLEKRVDDVEEAIKDGI